MAIKNSGEVCEGYSKQTVRHEVSPKEFLPGEKTKLLKLIELLGSAEYKANGLGIDEWISRNSLSKNAMIQIGEGESAHVCKIGICRTEFSICEHGQTLPCYRCDFYVAARDDLSPMCLVDAVTKMKRLKD